MTRKLQLALLVLVVGAWMAPAAHATDYCVAPNTSCGGTNVATFEAALGAADNATDSDRIFLGAATYTAAAATGFSYNAFGSPVEIVGAGRGATILTGQIGGSQQVLFLVAGAGSSIHDLTVRLPQNAASGSAGLNTNRLAGRIEVVEALTQANSRTGVRLQGGTLEASTVKIGGILTTNTVGVSTTGDNEVIRDSTIEGRTAIDVASGGARLERLVLRGNTGVAANRFTTTITDTLIQAVGSTATGIFAGTQAGQDATINTDGLTVIGQPADVATSAAVASTTEPSQSVSLNLANAVLRNFDQALVTFAAGPGEADINASYSDYDPSGNSDGGPGSITQTNTTNVGDARFVNAAGGDFRLRFDSPLIDTGEPGAVNTATDLAGGFRLVDGDAVAGARRDIGAYEYQARVPVASIAGPATAVSGELLSFSAAGSSDPDAGDSLTYAWTVDGAPAGNQPTVSAAFGAAGAHSIGLTVTDPTGRQASAAHTVTVAPSGISSDTIAPVVSNLIARPARVRRGRPVSFRFNLSEAASVRVRIRRLLPGRRVGGRCRRPSARNRNAPRCTRRVLVTSLTRSGVVGGNRVRFSGRVRRRALPAGRYEALVTATDAAGNRSVRRRVSFRVT